MEDTAGSPSTAQPLDAATVCARLEPWFKRHLGRDSQILSLEAPGTNGFSSETMLIEVAHPSSGGDPPTTSLVLKTRPAGAGIFPAYDLERQRRCIQAVASNCGVPVPRVRWFESDTSVLGREFYVMDRVQGEVPSDNPPYTISGFLYEAPPERQRHAYLRGLEVLAELHSIDVSSAGLELLSEGSGSGLEQQVGYYKRFLGSATDGRPHPVLDAALEWIERHLPLRAGEGLNWGDARLGNIVFRDFEPAAVLDWEMAALGPPEVDLAWYLFFVRFFSEHIGLENLPGFPSEDEGIAHYEAISGRRVRDMDFFFAWAAFRWGVIWVRLMGLRAGEMPPEWTHLDNPATRSVAELTGVAPPGGSGE